MRGILLDTVNLEAIDTISFRGHPNILGTHRNTIEITKDEEMSRRADCIIGVGANKACVDLSFEVKDLLQRGAKLRFEVQVGSLLFTFSGRGGEALDLKDERELVLRKSDYASSRTVAIRCDAAARDIPREIIKALQSPSQRGILRLAAFSQ